MITFRQVVDQRPDPGSESGGAQEAITDPQARRELWPEPVERPAAGRPAVPRYRRLGD